MEHFLCALLRTQEGEMGILFRLEDAQGDFRLTNAAITQLLLVLKADLRPLRCWLIRDSWWLCTLCAHSLLRTRN